MRVTQSHAIFYQLYNAREKDREMYTPVWKLVGEIYIEEIGRWGFVSYEASARMSELFRDNPDLFERRRVTGKSGSKYYEYRINRNVSKEDIKDGKLLSFYKVIKIKRQLKRNDSV